MKARKKLKICVSAFSLIILFSLILSRSCFSLTALLAAALHECGHILASRHCKIKLKQMKLGIFGASLVTEGTLCSYKSEIFLAAAGPLVNIFCFLLCSLVPQKSDILENFKIASLFLALLNLLPIKELDGGRIAYCTLASLLSPRVALRVVEGLSFSIIFSLWALSIYLILRLGASLSLFVFSCFLFCKIFLKSAYEN